MEVGRAKTKGKAERLKLKEKFFKVI